MESAAALYHLFMKSMGRKTVKGTNVSAPLSAKATATKPATSAAVQMTTATIQPAHDEIAKRAYELYLARGSVEGHQEEDWLLAEAELNRAAK